MGQNRHNLTFAGDPCTFRATGKDHELPPNDPIKLTPEIVRNLLNAGESLTSIAKQWSVSPQYVWELKTRIRGYSPTPREQAKRLHPWSVPERFQRTSPDKRLRDHAEYVLSGGDGMAEWKLRLLKGFYARLERQNVVVAFDPDTPPSPGINQGGYSYEPRRPEDGEYIVRLPSDTNLTEEEKIVWLFPSKRPET